MASTLLTLVSRPDDYGCSFVAKLSWKRFFFLKKYLGFWRNIHYVDKKGFYVEKKFYIFTEKNFLYREKFKWKGKKYILHLKNIFLYRKCLFYK